MMSGVAAAFLLAAAALPTAARASVALGAGNNRQRVVLHVDPCKDGLSDALSTAVEAFGASVVPIWSEATAAQVAAPYGAHKAPAVGEETQWAAVHLRDADIEGVVCGSDHGLACAERLQHALMPARSNAIDAARRDKYLANEALCAAGLEIAAQCAPSTWEEAKAFLTRLERSSDGAFRAVLKPRRGTASVGVFVAESVEEAEEIFRVLSRSTVSVDTSELVESSRVVVQEYLEGDEWIVDTVSIDGEHRVVAVWRYDKGMANGAPFVYNSAELMSSGTDVADAIMDYACAALDALSWRWGPCHIEVKATRRGPRLVEVNAGRCNGLDFKLLADVCYGYNQFDATVAAWLSADEAAVELPVRPPAQLACHARLVTLVSHVRGTLTRVQHTEEVCEMASMLSFEPEPSEAGEPIVHTTDLNSAAGHALMAHQDRAVLEADYARLRELQSTMFEVAAAPEDEEADAEARV